ncbi:MAG TPA: hypothetical protein VLA00_14375 [Xanthobacteraceae bacterium]|nr:hypothetical protein [Xanthobacteraceae bacterium]
MRQGASATIGPIDPESWAMLRQAAQRAGMPFEDWLKAAVKAEMDNRRAARTVPDPEAMGAAVTSPSRRSPLRRDGGGIASPLEATLQRLNERLESLAAEQRPKPAEPASKPSLPAEPVPASKHPADDAVPPTLETVIAEIAARQRSLDAPAAAEPSAAEPPPDLTALERRLGLIADQMQELRRAGPRPDALGALQGELAAIRRTLEALAPRQMVEQLERAVAQLAERLGERRGGTDPNSVETARTLADLGRAIGALRPPESPAALTSALDALSRKLDVMNAKAVDGAALARLQAQTAEIRDLLGRALSNDSLTRLAAQVALLAERLEQPAQPDPAVLREALRGIEARIDALDARLTEGGRADPALAAIQQRVDEVHALLAQAPHAGHAGIEATLAALAERVNSEESRLAQFTGVERALDDLFLQMEEARASALAAAQQTARQVATELATELAQAALPADVRRGLADLEARQESTERRTYDTLEAVHDTLERVVDRIAALEPPEREPVASPPHAETLPAFPHAPPVPSDDFAPLAPDLAIDLDRHGPARERRGPEVRGRVAGTPDADEPEAPSRADFIAAARRAAHSAAGAPKEVGEAAGGSARSPLARFLSRARLPLLLGVCGAALALGLGPALNAYKAATVKAPAPAVQTAQPARAPSPAAALAPRLLAPAPLAPAPLAPVPSSGLLGTGDPSAGDITGSVGTIAPPNPAPSLKPAVPASLAPASSAPPVNDLPPGLASSALRAAAAAGDAAALYEVGARFAEGRGASSDVGRAADWFERALARGCIPAAYRLGALLEKGAEDLPRDVARARTLYVQAAEAGNVRSMHNLAVLLAEGIDGRSGYTEAATWFRRAAERGVRDSQYNLGVLYARGLGIGTNLSESWKWFALAAAQGDNEAARKRDEVAASLDKATLATVRLTVQGWTPVAADDAANIVLTDPDWDRAELSMAKRKTASKN